MISRRFRFFEIILLESIYVPAKDKPMSSKIEEIAGVCK